jgi:hypothetical protein
MEHVENTSDVASGKLRPARKTRPQRGDKQYGRSRITNGNALLPGTDGRSTWVRRAKDIIGEALADLGGIDNTSAAERSIVRRAATLTVELERLEQKFALEVHREGRRLPPENLLIVAENAMAMAARYQPGPKLAPNEHADEGKYGFWLSQAREALRAAAATELLNLDAYQRCANSLRRLLESVGLQRRPRNVLAIDGTVEAPFSPLRARWAAEAEAAAAAKHEGDAADTVGTRHERFA